MTDLNQSCLKEEHKKTDTCRSFLSPSQLLLWDEPLNYLDVMTREQLEQILLEHQPTMVFVEYDRYFIDQVATDVIQLTAPAANHSDRHRYG